MARSLRALPGIVWLSAAALAFRLVLAYGLFAGSGFKFDIGTFVGWAQALARFGPGGFYANTGFADYPPGYMYVLWLIGSVGEAMSGLLGGGTVQFGGATWTLAFFFDAAMLKLPAIGADVLIGLVLYAVVRHWMRDRPRAETLALGAAALYLFNPVAWYDSALWGQVDAVGTLVVLCAIVFLVEGFSEAAVAAAILAGLIKPQYGVVLLAMVALLLLRRHLFAIGSGPRPGPGEGRLRRYLRDQQGPLRLASSAVVGALVFVLVATPFGLDPQGLVKRMSATAGEYPYLTVNAYNPWALVAAGGHASLATSDPVPALPASTGDWSPDDVPMLGPLSGVTIGAFLLAVAFLIALTELALRDSRRSILLTIAFLSLAFFILPTRVHERYAFPVFAILPLLAVRSRSFTIVTVVAALATLVNLHAVLTLPDRGTPDLTSLPLGEASRTLPWVLVTVLALTAVFIFLLWRLRPVVDLVIGPVRSRLGMQPRGPDLDPYE
jgi:dolichyl-phosphate-mannose-protein mannosyltransferase